MYHLRSDVPRRFERDALRVSGLRGISSSSNPPVRRAPSNGHPPGTSRRIPTPSHLTPTASHLTPTASPPPSTRALPTRVPAVSPTLPLPIPNGLTPNRPRLGRQTLGHQNPRHRTLRRPTQNTSATGPKRMSRKRARARMSSRPTSSIGRVEISKRIRPRPGLIPTHRQIRRARVPISTTSETSSTSSSRAFGS